MVGVDCGTLVHTGKTLFVVGYVSCLMAKPFEDHILMVKHIHVVCYTASTVGHDVYYELNKESMAMLYAFNDSCEIHTCCNAEARR
jgi:hypothetical protein